MTLALGLRHGVERRPARAWYVPGGNGSAWLDELLGFGFDWCRVLLLPVAAKPTARGGESVIGVLVVAPQGAVPQRVVRAQPYQQRADTVWLPVDTELWPPVDDEELQRLADGRQLVFHPSAGMVAFAPHEVGSLLDLLSAQPTPAGWDRARPGVVVTGTITEVIPEREPTIEQLFVQERTQIGQQSLESLPPLPGEPRERAGLLRMPGLRGMLAWLILHLTRNVPRTAAQPTWIDRLEAWSKRHVRSKRGFVDQDKRERELQRLLRLLQDDPSQGLRFALPIGGDAGRGLAPPSNRLGERIADFDMRRLGGGGPVDGWDVPAHLQWQLQQTYRELANAEIAAGRHRRAAYIFAHLLGDLHAAARALVAGRCYREAAVLYRERLESPELAVRCLVDGGLLVDAAKLEEELGHWEGAGDLRLILGQASAAEVLYLKQWHRLVQHEQWLPAAALRAEKLQDVGGALELLAERAREHGDRHAFAAWLAMAERAGRRDEVLRSLRQYRPSSLEPVPLAEVIAAFGSHVGPGELRDAARNRVRGLVAYALHTATATEQRRLLRAMRITSPDDSVLQHDVRRAAQRLERRVRPVRELLAHDGRVGLTRIEQRLTPKGVRWSSAAATDTALWLTGKEVISRCFPVFRLPWAHDREVHRRPRGEEMDQSAGQLAPARSEDAVWLRTARSGFDAQQWLKRLDHVDGRLWNAGSGSISIESSCCAFAVDDDGSIWRIYTQAHAYVLSHESRAGHLIASELLPYEIDDDDVPMLVALQGRVLIAKGYRLLLRMHEGRMLRHEVESPVRTMVRSEEGSNPLVLIGLDAGLHALHVFADDLDGLPVFARGLEQPTLGWTRSGVAIAVDRFAVWLARARDHVLADPPLQDYVHGKPWAIVPTPDPGEVVFLGQETITRTRVVG